MAKRKSAKGHRGALRLYAEVLGLEHLHYGLWDGDPFNLDGLKAAQARYTSHLTGQIGPEVRSILDCGCGIGTTARMLSERGYEVEALTPDAEQKKTVEERSGLTCHLARFQDFRPRRAYDLVLMSESCGYIPVDGIFAAVKAAAPGGQWLLADLFTLYKDGSKLTKSGHLLEEFLARAELEGLRLEFEDDITERITPTLDLARRFVDDQALPAARMLDEYLVDRYPWVYPPLSKLARFLARKPLAKAEDQRVLIDSEAFRRAKRYMIYRFAVPGNTA